MKITDQGITAINGALGWAEFATGKDYKLDDVEISQHKGCGNSEFAIVLEVTDDCDQDIIGEGKTFTEAAHAFYAACKAAEAASPDLAAAKGFCKAKP